MEISFNIKIMFHVFSEKFDKVSIASFLYELAVWFLNLSTEYSSFSEAQDNIIISNSCLKYSIDMINSFSTSFCSKPGIHFY